MRLLAGVLGRLREFFTARFVEQLLPRRKDASVNRSVAVEQPLVSVLTPSYNQGRWLGDNLHSVACQTYPNIEHIVMDGGSTDNSVDVLKAARSSVRWRSEPDRGQADAINKAFCASKGEIIGWLNSDDAYFDCQAVERAVAYFEGHPDVDLVYGHAASVAADGTLIHMFWVPPFRQRRLKWFSFIVQPAAFIRRSALSDPMLDASFHFAMDYELWLRLAQGHAIRRVNQVLAVDRVQPSRKSKTMKDVELNDLGRLAELYGRYWPRQWFWDPYQRLYHVFSRFAGALLIRKIPRQLAFTSPPADAGALLKRQIGSRRTTWPKEYI